MGSGCSSGAGGEYRSARDAVVSIEATGCRPTRGQGAGIALEDGRALTAAHVVAGADTIWVEDRQGVRHRAEVVAIDVKGDLAVIEAPGLRGGPIEFSEQGNDGRGIILRLDGSDTEVVPYRIDRTLTLRINDIYDHEPTERLGHRLEADIDPGDSGAVLIDDDGRVAGMVFASSRTAVASGYATAAVEIERFLSQLPDNDGPVPCRDD